jgi:type I restriction enzyme S subunit
MSVAKAIRNDRRAGALDMTPWCAYVVEVMRAALSQIDLERLTLSKLQSQKLGLMDDLLTGRVRVTPLLAASDV